MSQIITFSDPRLEKFYVFVKCLNRKLPKRESALPWEVLSSIDLDSFRIQMKHRGKIKLGKEDSELEPASADAHKHAEEQRDLLSNLVKALNETFGTALTSEEVEEIQKHIVFKWESDSELLAILSNDSNSEENKRRKSNDTVDKLITDFFYHTKVLYKKLKEQRANEILKGNLFQSYKMKKGAV